MAGEGLNEHAPKLVSVIVFALLWVYFITLAPWPQGIPTENLNQPLRLVGTFLFESYAPVVFVAVLLLTAAMLGAVFLAKEEG
ncbi:MAG: hypothetical protein ACE5PO_00955 [Candidatus Bathyarchaeia archaeon]